MLSVSTKNDSLGRLADAVERSGRKLPREISTAVNAAARKTKSIIAKGVTTELATRQKTVKQHVSQSRKSVPTKLQAAVRLAKSKRIPLKEFKPRQTRAGVSYRISKRTGRATIPGAFQGPRPGLMKASWRGNVFKRVGKSRLPIVKLFGPSPWGVFVKRKMSRPTAEQARAELMKQLERRIRFNNLKADGTI